MSEATTNNNNTHSIADYLAQLLKDRKQLAAFPSVFVHVERLLDEGKQPKRVISISWLFSCGIQCLWKHVLCIHRKVLHQVLFGSDRLPMMCPK